MQYEFNTLKKLVSGTLSLNYTRRSDLSQQRHFLQDRFPLCMKHYAVHFSLHNEKWQFISFDRSTQEQLYDLPMAFPERHYPALNRSPYAYLLDWLVDYFQLPQKDIEWTSYHHEENQLTIELVVLSDFQEIDAQEVYFHYYQTMLYIEGEKIKERWAKVIFSLTQEDEIRLYVQNHQRALDRLRAKVKSNINSQEHHRLHEYSPTFTIEDTYKAMYTALDALMMHLESQYGKFVDDKACLSFRSRLRAYQELSPALNLLLERLTEDQISDDLQKIIKMPINHFQRLPYHQEVTYRELVYGKQLIKSLAHDSQEPKDELDYVQVLLREDFNHPDLLDFLSKKIEADIEAEIDPVSRLRFWIKQCRQLPITNPLSYLPNLPPLKEQLLEWLQEELVFRKEVEGQDEKTKTLSVDQMIPIGLSVPQWALLLRLLHEVGILLPRQKSDLFRTFSQLVSTNRVHKVSAGSLQSNYYRIEEGASRVVKDKIIEMLNVARKITQ
ncbi:hypothetical protein WJR50_12310 [Catalinimonas sp. 4WD22]|uniref:hypothetical protein n=1 Tax=Catalinimonas locisalis TaxID=3133978 RepID=UPI0031013E4A